MKIVGTALAIFWVRTSFSLIVVAVVSILLFQADSYLKSDSKSKAVWFLKEAGMESSIDESVRAAGDGRLFSLAMLGFSGVDMGQVGDTGETPMIAAIKGDADQVVEYLIQEFEVERTLFVRSADAEASTAFEEAVEAGKLCLAKNIQLIVEELNSGERPDLEEMVRRKYDSLPALRQINPKDAIARWGDDFSLVLAVERRDQERIRRLADFGADVNTSGVDGNSLLVGAILKGDYPLIIDLIESGASINQKAELSIATPLEAAIQFGQFQMVELVLERGANPNLLLSGGASPLAYVVNNQRADLANALIQKGAEFSASVLTFSALENDDQACLRLLLKNGASPDTKNSDGVRLIDLALIRNLTECAKVLLDAGANTKKSLAFALHSDNPMLVDLLLSYGANLDQLGGEEGGALLDYAFKTNNMKLVAILIKHGANLDVISREGGGLRKKNASDSVR